MPTKNITFENATLFINGINIGAVNDLQIEEVSSENYSIGCDGPLFTSITREFNVNCEMKISRNLLLYLAYGILPPNNWLKMHNHPMRRRYRKH